MSSLNQTISTSLAINCHRYPIADASRWSNLPEELLNQVATPCFLKDARQAAALHLVCRSWRAFILNHVSALCPQNIDHLPISAPRFSRIHSLTISQEACDRSRWPMQRDDSLIQGEHIASNHQMVWLIGHMASPALNLAYFGAFDKLVYLNVEGNRYINDASFQSLQKLTSLRSINAARCSELINLCDLRGCKIQAMKFSRCFRLSDLALQALAHCGQLLSLDLANCRACRNGFKALSALEKLTRLNLSRNLSTCANHLSALTPLHTLSVLKLENLHELSPSSARFFSSMINLSSLSLSGTPFQVQMLKALSSLINLTDLDLSRCLALFSGGLREVTGLKKLTQLALVSCRFSDVEELTALTHLRKLRLKRAFFHYQNRVKDISQLRNLEHLDMGGSNIKSSALRSIGTLNELTFLSVGSCRRQKTIKKGCAALSIIRHLNARSLQFNETLLKDFVTSHQLTYLNLSDSNITDCDLNAFEHLDKLVHLNLNRCSELKKRAMIWLSRCSALRHLHLSKSALTSYEISSLTHLKSLETLDLSYSSGVSNEAFQTIGQLINLRVLNLRHTLVTALQSCALTQLRHLRTLDLAYCRLGNLDLLPLFCFKSLMVLDLSGVPLSYRAIASFNQKLPKTKLITASDPI